MKNKYRIVRDRYLGYECQVKFWWFPLMWFQMNGNSGPANTHSSAESAERYINLKRSKIVKYVD